MKKYQLYDQFDACVVAEGDSIEEIEKVKAEIIKRCPKYSQPNRLVTFRN